MKRKRGCGGERIVGTDTISVKYATLAAAFAASAGQHADRTAVIEGDCAVSFAELAGLAGGIASLIASATNDDSPPADGESVGLLLDHGIPMVAAILGVLASGRSYLPLDPTYPHERLRSMLHQAGARTTLALPRHRRLAESILPTQLTRVGRLVEIDDMRQAPIPCNSFDPARPAYILFTSGSTGRPKGVAHSHRSVLRGIANHISNLELSPDDRLSLISSFSYDMSVSDLYGALLSGGAVVLSDVRTQGLPRLADALVRSGVTVYHSTPTVFRSLVHFLIETHGPSVRLPQVRTVLLGGEQAHRTDLQLARAHFGARCLFVNGYGATEVSFTVQNHILAGADPTAGETISGDDVLPIGLPLDGYEPVLLDLKDDTPLPEEGATGPAELAIRSDYLALGYVGDQVATEESFGIDGKLYRTGDIVRRMTDGQYLHMGRMDRQVKVHGHRIELGEVEAVLESLADVLRAVVVLRPIGTGAEELQGFVQPSRSRGVALHPPDLRNQLAQQLPAHMLPRSLLIVERLPLTPSGKVDVRALLAAQETPSHAPHVPVALPVGEREESVARIWSEVLGVGEVDRDTAGFFDAGGTSLQLTRLQYRLAEATGVDIPLSLLVEHPTVAGMARLCDGVAESPDAGDVSRRMAARRVAQSRRAALLARAQ